MAWLFLPFFLFGQENQELEIDSDKENGLELVFSVLGVYNTESDNIDPAGEVLLTYWINSKWATGMAYSMVFEEHNRIGHEITPLISHKPWAILTINAGPSIALGNSERDTEVSAYAEGEFNFRLGDLHAGPVVGTLVGQEFRIFVGLHLGIEF